MTEERLAVFGWVGSDDYYSLFKINCLRDNIKLEGSSICFEPWIKLWPKPFQDTARSACFMVFNTLRHLKTDDMHYAIKNVLLTEFTLMENRSYLDDVLKRYYAVANYYEVANRGMGIIVE